MSSRVFLVFFALAACGAPGAVPREVERELGRGVAAGTIRIEVEGGGVRAWTLPIDPADLPERARRAAIAVQPGGVIAYAAREFRDDVTRFVVEKRYEAQGTGEFRSVTVSAEGDVLRRSHTIAIDAAPDRVQAAIDGRPVRFEFVQGQGPDRYRASFGGTDSPERYVEFLPDGSIYRRAFTHRAEMTVTPA